MESLNEVHAMDRSGVMHVFGHQGLSSSLHL